MLSLHSSFHILNIHDGIGISFGRLLICMESEPTLLMVVKFAEQGMHGYALRFCFVNNFLGRTRNNVHQVIFGLNMIGFYHLDFSLFCSRNHRNS